MSNVRRRRFRYEQRLEADSKNRLDIRLSLFPTFGNVSVASRKLNFYIRLEIWSLRSHGLHTRRAIPCGPDVGSWPTQTIQARKVLNHMSIDTGRRLLEPFRRQPALRSCWRYDELRRRTVRTSSLRHWRMPDLAARAWVVYLRCQYTKAPRGRA